jgi:glycosyltransferase involved in cell wall biosynthesis
MTPSPAPPRISVALCAFNGAHWLPEQLDSVLAQEGVSLEIVALDDASTDGSLELLRSRAAEDPRIRVFANERNLGHVKSFERCMGLCEGALIAPCDQDDVWHPRKLAILLDALGEADLAYCDSEYIDASGRPIGRRVSQDLKWMHSGNDPLRYVFQNTVSGHAALLRREVFDGALPFPPALYHDWWLALRAAAGRGVVYVDQPLVQFRRHDLSASPMGGRAAGVHRKRSSSHNRKWIARLLYVFDQLRAVDWFPRRVSSQWAVAMRSAEHGHVWRLWKAIWHSRASVPPYDQPRWLAAVRFGIKCANKVLRARRERAFEGPLFK